MKIAILGSNGQIGKVLFKQLCNNYPDAEIVACVRHYHLYFEGVTGNKKQHSISFDPFTDNWTALKNIDVLINCVGIIKETSGFSFDRVHKQLTELILKNRKVIGNPRVIQVSVLGADKKSTSEFMKTKGIADELLVNTENAFVVRPSIVCSHNTVLVQKFKLMKRMSRIMFGLMPFPAGFLKTKIQPVLVEDLCNLISELCLNHTKERIIEVTGPEIYEIKDLINIMGGMVTIPIPQTLFNLFYNLFYPVLKNVLSRGEYGLLVKDNIAKKEADYFGLKMHSTKNFWKEELRTWKKEVPVLLDFPLKETPTFRLKVTPHFQVPFLDNMDTDFSI